MHSAAAHLAADRAQPLAVNGFVDPLAVAWNHIAQVCFQTVLAEAPGALGVFAREHRRCAFHLDVLAKVAVLVVLSLSIRILDEVRIAERTS